MPAGLPVTANPFGADPFQSGSLGMGVTTSIQPASQASLTAVGGTFSTSTPARDGTAGAANLSGWGESPFTTAAGGVQQANPFASLTNTSAGSASSLGSNVSQTTPAPPTGVEVRPASTDPFSDLITPLGRSSFPRRPEPTVVQPDVSQQDMFWMHSKGPPLLDGPSIPEDPFDTSYITQQHYIRPYDNTALKPHSLEFPATSSLSATATTNNNSEDSSTHRSSVTEDFNLPSPDAPPPPLPTQGMINIPEEAPVPPPRPSTAHELSGPPAPSPTLTRLQHPASRSLRSSPANWTSFDESPTKPPPKADSFNPFATDFNKSSSPLSLTQRGILRKCHTIDESAYTNHTANSSANTWNTTKSGGGSNLWDRTFEDSDTNFFSQGNKFATMPHGDPFQTESFAKTSANTIKDPFAGTDPFADTLNVDDETMFKTKAVCSTSDPFESPTDPFEKDPFQMSDPFSSSTISSQSSSVHDNLDSDPFTNAPVNPKTPLKMDKSSLSFNKESAKIPSFANFGQMDAYPP